jgi:hypothetical protein
MALGCLVIAFPLAMVVGEGLLTLLAEDPENPALTAVAVAGGTGTLLLVSPLVVSLLFGRRGLAQGDDRAKIPMIVSGIVLVVLLAQTLLGVVGLLL